MNCIGHMLHDRSARMTRYLACLVLFCVSVAAHAQSNPIISGFGTARIDGLKQSGEWATAGRLVFDARMDGERTERKAFAILYAMNDEDHLFLALVTESGLLDSRWLRFSLNNGSETAEFFFNQQSGQLLQEVPGANPEWLFEVPKCCRAKVDSSQGYDVLEFEYSQAPANPNSSLALMPGTRIELQMTLVACAELPGNDTCWASAHDAFITESGKFEIDIQITGSQITPSSETHMRLD